MGLYDRDYVRGQPRGFILGGDHSMVTKLIVINLAVFLVDALFFDGELSAHMAVSANLFHERPWNALQLLTCGFAHQGVQHIFFNMLTLWFFGRDVEERYGPQEFLRIYLFAIVFSSLVWVTSTHFRIADEQAAPWWPSMLGASGAVTTVLILFILHYPRRTVLVNLFIPIPAWLLGVLYISSDLYLLNHRLNQRGSPVAFEAHLAGAAFAFLYYYTGWNFGRIAPRRLSWGLFKRRPKLRVHEGPQREEDLGRQVDRILEKISREGEASLTTAERGTLEEASRRYQQRRK